MKLALFAAAVTLCAGAACAQPADPLHEAAFQPRAGLDLALARSEPARPAGVAKTSIDHRFDRKNLDGSVGFLCGLQPKSITEGAAAAYGVDPNGRFVGLKLHMTLR
ncbi:hypothetical protein [Phenylobacterium sp.]|uniref:hypothetical protein n=1 Tax=Phenylobacterium sp. TaxID=1871053 RepID=UPI002DE6A563|nr:hypothetical protein [Phenylobacterium sp.]